MNSRPTSNAPISTFPGMVSASHRNGLIGYTAYFTLPARFALRVYHTLQGSISAFAPGYDLTGFLVASMSELRTERYCLRTTEGVLLQSTYCVRWGCTLTQKTW
jgi:hypothetical protein